MMQGNSQMVSTLLVRISVVLGLVGIGGGIAMGISENFTLVPAHAHLNLLGYVALFLSGLYYHAVPEAAGSLLAKFHVSIAIVGAVLFPLGIAVHRLGGSTLLVAVGSITVFIGSALFVAVAFRYRLARAA
jgi:hypothetical protein